jgi:hypothetical protein
MAARARANEADPDWRAARAGQLIAGVAAFAGLYVAASGLVCLL